MKFVQKVLVGQGLIQCEKLLGELGAAYLGFNASKLFQLTDREKRVPVKAFIRYCDEDKEITINTPVTRPVCLGFSLWAFLRCQWREAMIGKLQVTAGVDENSCIVINSGEQPDVIRDKLKLCVLERYIVLMLNLFSNENKM